MDRCIELGGLKTPAGIQTEGMSCCVKFEGLKQVKVVDVLNSGVK